MDNQQSELLLQPAQVGAYEHVTRPAHPRGTVSGPRRSGFKLLARLSLIAAIATAVVCFFPRSETQPKSGNRAPSSASLQVGVVPVVKGDMPVALNQLGTVTPLTTVTVKTQISGYLMQVAFHEGQMVNKGDFLAQIDPRPYEVALEQTRAQLAKDQALLKNALLDLQRYNILVAENSIAKQIRDTQEALVGQYQATVKADQAQIDAQKLNLTYCRIISPVSGRVGLRLVDPGNYVQMSDPNGIVVITQLKPISVMFTTPQDNLPEVMGRLRAGVTLDVIAYDRTGTHEIARGGLDTVDNQIDTTTGTVKLRAIFDNKEENLFPNQFVNVKLIVNTIREAYIVPNSAIQRGAPGTFVYVVKPDRTVMAQKVTLGPTDSQRAAITSGLQPGDSVVVDGADRLRDGAKVTAASAGSSHQDTGQTQAAAGSSTPSRTETEPVAAIPQQSVRPAAEAHPTLPAAPLQPAALNDRPRVAPGLASAAATITQPPEPRPTPPKQVVALTQPRLSAAEIAGLVKRGDDFVAAGDITSARLFYERAIEAGDRVAAVRMGITFDPVFLNKVGIRPTVGNQREALAWYQFAQ
jgi:multidrug efflux system membrane fusion protein